jgi:hypothetical protein
VVWPIFSNFSPNFKINFFSIFPFPMFIFFTNFKKIQSKLKNDFIQKNHFIFTLGNKQICFSD